MAAIERAPSQLEADSAAMRVVLWFPISERFNDILRAFKELSSNVGSYLVQILAEAVKRPAQAFASKFSDGIEECPAEAGHRG